MIKVDLVTGFLGAGKTTFIKKYASYLVNQGINIGILENDHGAINVDMLLLNGLRSDKCELEMVAGGCDMDCHRRRFKTKLISMAMSGYERVIVEPSGIFDVDEFFDALRDDPLDNWYEIGNVFCIVDANDIDGLSDRSKYMLVSEMGNAGRIVVSHIGNEDNDEDINDFVHNLTDKLNSLLEKNGCDRVLKDSEIFAKNWDCLDEKDYRKLLNSDYKISSAAKKYSIDDEAYKTLYFLEHELKAKELSYRIKRLFDEESTGLISRVKGFALNNDAQGENRWTQINVTKNSYSESIEESGQEVLIVIGENLNEKAINNILFMIE